MARLLNFRSIAVWATETGRMKNAWGCRTVWPINGSVPVICDNWLSENILVVQGSHWHQHLVVQFSTEFSHQALQLSSVHMRLLLIAWFYFSLSCHWPTNHFIWYEHINDIDQFSVLLCSQSSADVVHCISFIREKLCVIHALRVSSICLFIHFDFYRYKLKWTSTFNGYSHIDCNTLSKVIR